VGSGQPRLLIKGRKVVGAPVVSLAVAGIAMSRGWLNAGLNWIQLKQGPPWLDGDSSGGGSREDERRSFHQQ